MAVKLNEKELQRVSGGSTASEIVRNAKEQQKNTTHGNCILTENAKDNPTNANTGVIHGSQNNNTIDIS